MSALVEPTERRAPMIAPVDVPAEQPRTPRRRAGIAVTWVAVFVAAFLAFEFGLSAVVQTRSQHLLLDRFRQLSDQGPASTLGWQPAPGDPVGVLGIPRLGLDLVVVEGTTSRFTQDGPGHYRGSPLPGRPGNSVIMARRTSFGAPFDGLDTLGVGDTIDVATGVGSFIYRVLEVRQVLPGQPDVLGPSTHNRLTLVTSAPPYRASRRLVAIAALVGRPAREPLRPTVAVSPDENGLSGDPGGLPLILLWAELLLLAGLAARWLARRTTKRAAWLLATPVVLALVWSLFGAIDRLLPATL